MKFRESYLISLLGLIITLACTRDDVQVEVITPQAIRYDAMCQRDTIRFSSNTDWTVDSDCVWCTVENDSGTGNGAVSLYIQQNDGGSERDGHIVVRFAGNKEVEFTISQDADDLNGYNVLVNLPMTYGVGWGYDYSVDHADIDGIRGQIVDEAKLNKITGHKSLISEPYTSTYIESVSAQSSTQLIERLSASISGEIDIKIASAKISGSFSKQTAENKDRLYIWYRDIISVRKAYLNADIFDVVENCLTTDFRTAINEVKKGGSPKAFVNRYGTHFIWNTTLGGKFDWYFTISNEIKETVERLVTTITVKLLFWKKTSTSVDEKIWQEVKKDFIAYFEVTGGGDKGKMLNSALQATASKGEPLSDPDLITRWQNCFTDASTVKEDEFTIIDFEVYPIWEVVEIIDEVAAAKIEKYILEEYLK